MDPDYALTKARDALERLHAAGTNSEKFLAAFNLADAFEGLDIWLSGGGLLPADWDPVSRFSR